MDSKLRERFARLGPIRAVDRVSGGSHAVFMLRRPKGRGAPKTVDCTLLLARRGATLLRAKRAVEQMIASGRASISLPSVEDPATLIAELAKAGVAAAQLWPQAPIDIVALRNRLGLTRKEFSLRYGLELETVRNWEVGRREPDMTAKSYLRAIANDPERVEEAFAPSPQI